MPHFLEAETRAALNACEGVPMTPRDVEMMRAIAHRSLRFSLRRSLALLDGGPNSHANLNTPSGEYDHVC